MIETIEHLQNPELALKEAFRILKPNGIGLITCPFLVKLHGDPFDFQRYTSFKLKNLLRENGFIIVFNNCAGNIFSTIHDLIHGYLIEKSNRREFLGVFLYKLFNMFNFIFKKIDIFFKDDPEIYLSNHFIVKK